MTDTALDHAQSPQVAPHPGSQSMPRWDVAELIDAPKFTWRNWAALVGPGLIMGGAAIGGGEWLTGPLVTARYGGTLLWLATLSIAGQVIYNLEISRYTLYTGEPIFTGKFRTLPGPMFWVFIYLLLDLGSIFPYLAGSAATPLAAVMLGHVPDVKVPFEQNLLRYLSYGIFLAAMIPLVFGGKIFNALRAIMLFKIIAVMSFLLVLTIFFSRPSTWTEIFSGFFEFGNVPIRTAEDRNGNGVLDPGEDWDRDGRLDVAEPSFALVIDTDKDGKPDASDFNEDRQPDRMINRGSAEAPDWWPDIDGDGIVDESVTLTLADGTTKSFPIDADDDGKPDAFVDVDGDGTRDGDNVENMISAAVAGRPLPYIDWSMIALLSALVGISGSGGLTNTPISNYTRDQGWGMGHHVGAIPSMVGGHDLQLSHVGTVFIPGEENLPRWKRWCRHVLREQLVVWMPACFFGLALPSMLSAEFLPRGTVVQDKWVAASMTAGAVQERVGGELGNAFWFMTLFCGFLVLAPSMATTADGVVRRWVDVFWTASAKLRSLDPRSIRYVYFGVLTCYAVFGLVMLSQAEPQTLLLIATTIYNFALGFSCWHTLWLNHALLPKPLRPGLFRSASLFLAGLFFWVVAVLSTLVQFKLLS